MTSTGEPDRRWTFVTNHALVLAYIAKDPEARLRDIADGIGVTERTAAQIVNDLEQAGRLPDKDSQRTAQPVHDRGPQAT